MLSELGSSTAEKGGEDRFIERFERFWDSASAYLLLLVGFLGLGYESWHRFEALKNPKAPLGPDEAIIILLSILCLGISVERVIVLRKIRAGMNEAKEQRQDIRRTAQSILQNLSLFEARTCHSLEEVLAKEQALGLAFDGMGRSEVFFAAHQIEIVLRKIL